jgi:hypothetical protein
MTVWNERPARRMPILVSPTIGAAITARDWFLRAALALSCQFCGPMRPQVDIAGGAAGAGHSPGSKR